MPLYDFKCEECNYFEEDVFLHCGEINKEQFCPACKKIMLRLFPKGTHAKIDGTFDGKNVGKKIMEKNQQLKDREEGYSHELRSIKEKTMAQYEKIYGDK